MDGGFWGGLWNFFVPPDPPLSDFVNINDADQRLRAEEHMKQLRYWRFKVTGSLVLAVGVLGWSVTPWGFVQAGDLKAKIEEVLAPLKETQEKQDQRLKNLELVSTSSARALNELVANGVATDICRIVIRERKEVDPGERGALRADKDDKQRRYEGLMGKYYPEERCGS